MEGLYPVLEAPAFVAGFDDLAVMRQAVEQCGRHLCIPKHAGPFTECQIGRDDDRGALVELADQICSSTLIIGIAIQRHLNGCWHEGWGIRSTNTA